MAVFLTDSMPRELSRLFQHGGVSGQFEVLWRGSSNRALFVAGFGWILGS